MEATISGTVVSAPEDHGKGVFFTAALGRFGEREERITVQGGLRGYVLGNLPKGSRFRIEKWIRVDGLIYAKKIEKSFPHINSIISRNEGEFDSEFAGTHRMRMHK